MATDYSKDFNFITDRLAIGSLASRSTPGFVAVVLQGDDVVAAYRRFYAAEKQGYWVGERWVVSKWTKRDVPWFMLDGEATML